MQVLITPDIAIENANAPLVATQSKIITEQMR